MSVVVGEVRGMEDGGREGEKIRVLYVDDEEGAIHVTNIFFEAYGIRQHRNNTCTIGEAGFRVAKGL